MRRVRKYLPNVVGWNTDPGRRSTLPEHGWRLGYRVMMPSAQAKRNAISLFLVGIVSSQVSCSERLGVEVILRTPEAPDPFAGVARLRMIADLDRGVEQLGVVRWDQGPVALVISNPAVQRLVIEGLDADDRVVSSGASRTLDFLAEPPDGPITIDFTRIGVLSQWSETVAVRRGGQAVDLGDGRWLAVGGLDDAGCPREDTEIFGPARRRDRVGPPLIGGRTGDFSALPLANGEVLVVQGIRYADCARASDSVPVRLDPSSGRAVSASAPVEWPAGTAVAPLSSTLVLAAGGLGSVTARTEVFGYNPQSFSNQVVGTLSIPRARGTLVALGPQRALMLGGQTQTSTDSGLGDASIFEPSRGTTLEERISLGAAVVEGPAVRTAAGSVVYLLADSVAGRSEVRTVVVKREREVPIGDVSPVTVTTSTESGRLLPLADGSLLRLGRRQLDWIQLLPRQAVSVSVEEGPLYGGMIGDGTALLFDPSGRRYTFNPGPASTLGWRGPAGTLRATEGPSLGRGLVPRRPARWRLTVEGLEGSQPAEGVELGEWVVAVDRIWDDFEFLVSVRAAPSGRAFLLWGANRERFTYVDLGATLRINRFGVRGPPCETAAGPDPGAEGWSGEVRLRREGRRVTIETPTAALSCAFDDVSGWLGLGVAEGTVTFANIRVGAP